MDSILGLLGRTVDQVALSLLHTWPFLLASIAIAAVLSHALDARRLSAFLGRHRRAGVALATAAAVGTPFCSCGTTAVVLGMMASTMPWAPIVAFMVASPLSSPEGVVYTAGLFGWPFAIGMFAASVALGLAGGIAAMALEARGLLRAQARRIAPLPMAAPPAAAASCGCPSPRRTRVRKLQDAATGTLRMAGRLLATFLGFAFIGYLLNDLIPSSWVSTLFASGTVYGVPLAATLGLPFYLSSEASLPLVRALLESGMSQGAVMAFLIAGSGTSIGAIAGALTIARWRVVALVVGVLWIGAMAAGFGWNLILATGVIA